MAPPTALALGRLKPLAMQIGAQVRTSVNFAGILTPPVSSPITFMALRLIEPPPQVLIVGGAFSDQDASDAQGVFGEFQKEIGVLEKGLTLRVPPELMPAKGIEGVAGWIKEQCAAAGIAECSEPTSTLPTAITLGKHRQIARDFAKQLADLVNVSAIYTHDYSDSSLSMALHMLNPPPRVLLVGGGYLDDAPKAKLIFTEFWRVHDPEEKIAFVSVDPAIWTEKGKEGVAAHLRKGITEGLGLSGRASVV